MTSKICQEATRALHAYLHAEATGDLPATLALLSPDHCGFGTGPDELLG